jgi:hypothetical protein
LNFDLKVKLVILRQAFHIWHVGKPPSDNVPRTIVGDL